MQAKANAEKAPKHATPASRAKVAKGPDAIALLKSDHDAVDKLFKQYERGSDSRSAKDKRALAEKICAELTVHAKIEEEIFYPKVREALEDADDLLDEALVEHGSLKVLIATIRKASPDDDLYDANVKVLGEYVKHHVKEEESEMFPKVKKSDLDLKAIGAQLAARKQALSAA